MLVATKSLMTTATSFLDLGFDGRKVVFQDHGRDLPNQTSEGDISGLTILICVFVQNGRRISQARVRNCWLRTLLGL